MQLPRDSKEIWVSARGDCRSGAVPFLCCSDGGCPREIIRHYETIEEGRRISEGLGQLELLRTQEVLGRHLPKSPSSIVDVGGATGVHAEWLASLGYDVHVIDLMPHHVEAVSRLTVSPGRVTAEVGDARDLPVADGSFDAVLLFGPLYHLTERVDRLRARGQKLGERCDQVDSSSLQPSPGSHRSSTVWPGDTSSTRPSERSSSATFEMANIAIQPSASTGSRRPTSTTQRTCVTRPRRQGWRSSSWLVSRDLRAGCLS